MTNLHKYRCETCKYNDNRYCEVFDYRLHSSEIDTLEAFGCASHSDCVEDFVSLAGKMEDVNRKNEREKVLEEAIKAIEARINGIFEAYRGETNEKRTDRPFAMADGMGECVLMLKTLRSSQKECYDGSQCVDGKSDACNICSIPLQKGEKVSCTLHTICKYVRPDCFTFNPEYQCDMDSRKGVVKGSKGTKERE